MSRNDGRTYDQLREIKFTRGWLDHAEGSVLVEFGKTRVLCVASFSPGVPRWLKDSGNGWVTSEYSMLPRATHTRSDRESVKGKLGGRTQEISRLVGRSLRAIVDMKELGENTIVIDCDVAPLLHNQLLPADAVRTTLPGSQKLSGPFTVIVAVGNGFTVTVVADEVLLQVPVVTITL